MSRLKKDTNLKEKYVVESYISNGHAELTKPSKANSSGWYLPHHHLVLHPHQPNKVCIVFDCAA